MSLFIIDNKKVEMTYDEQKMYEKIVQSYTNPPYQKGEDFFIDLFEVDENGIIIYLKPPSKRQVSLEIYLFVMSIFQHQHLRLMHKEVEDVVAIMKQKINDLDEKLYQADLKVKQLKELIKKEKSNA